MPTAPRQLTANPNHHSPNTMNITKSIGMLLLAIYLILIGIIGVSDFSLGQAAIVLPILAIAAGVFILIGK